jgi:cytochrome c-type biogenesis protein CcmH
MTVFLIFAAALGLLAMAFVLTPLLRQGGRAEGAARDQLNLQVLRHQMQELEADLARGAIDPAAYGDARSDLERRVAEEVRPAEAPAAGATTGRWQAALLALAVPALAAGLYYKLGAPAGLDPALARPAQSQSHELTEAQITAMVESLAQRLKGNPDDIDGWNMLARSYNALGRYAEAADAYAELARLIKPDDAGLLADYADTLAMARGRSLLGEPEQLVARALAADPRNIKALALAGSAAFERKAYADAIGSWKKVLELVPAESDMARSTANGIAEAEQLAGIAPSAAAPKAAQPQAAAANATVSGTVELDPNLRGRVSDTDTVFIYARAAQGPRFPLAVLRKQVKDLPARFELDDSMSMMPQAKLSGFPLVVVGARISKSGSATPAPGDLEGSVPEVRPGTGELRIVIDGQRK